MVLLGETETSTFSRATNTTRTILTLVKRKVKVHSFEMAGKEFQMTSMESSSTQMD